MDSTVALQTGDVLSCCEQGRHVGPALVLLPGPTDSWKSYAQVLKLIPRSIRTIAVSPRGHGDSDKPARGYAVGDLASDVVLLLDALRIERAVLAGHSGSCLVVRRVAIDRPERVAGLVLEASPTTLRHHAGFEEFVEATVSRLEDPISPDFVRTFLGDTSSREMAPEWADQLAEEVLKVPARVWRETFAGLQRYDDTSDLGLIRAPTLLIWGDADALVGREMQDELVAKIPLAELSVWPGVGHTPRWHDPTRFAVEMAAFGERALRAGA